MKRLIAVITFVVLCFNVLSALAENDEKSEAINFELNYILERFYENSSIECEPLDISGQANMGFADEVEGDGKGGWTDQGPKNDMSSFKNFGSQKFWNIPFNIINPDKNEGKSCIILRGQNNEAFPISAEVPVNTTAGGIYVLHSTAYGAGEKAGRYSFVYEDGTSAYFDIVGDQHIKDFWGTLENNFTRVAWKGSNASSANITLNIFALNNPHPDKTIKLIRFESDGEGQFINIVGVTLAKELPIFPAMAMTGESNPGVVRYGIAAWKKYTDPDENVAQENVLNMSEYLDAPAGKYGLLLSKGDKFIFEDGTVAKFWGTNIVGNAAFPTMQEAEEIASRLSRSGYNLVRFVNLDNEELTDERLDKLSYFLKLLKDNGIYAYFSLLGNEKGDGDKITDGWKIDGIFRDDLIEKKAEFTKKLLTHKNKYTNTAIGKDEMLVMIDMADQNSMFDMEYGFTVLNVNDENSMAELTQKFNKFLKKKYSTTGKLSRVYSDLLSTESIEKGTVIINGNWRYGIFDENRKADVIEFFIQLQNDYYQKMKSVINSCGCKALVSGFTNRWDNVIPLHSIANSQTDFVPMNTMFSMGVDRTKDWPYLTELKDNTIFLDVDSTVSSDGHDGKSLINLVKTKVDGKPFVVSEWGAANISKQYGENSIVMAAISAQQGWTPIQYCFIYGEINKDKISDVYSTYNNPVTLGMSYASAALYYTMDELKSKQIINQSISDVYKNKSNSIGITSYLAAKTSNKFNKKNIVTKFNRSNEFIVDNGNVYWDMLDGVFFANTDEVIAFSGNVSKEESLGCLKFEIYSDTATIALVSLDKNKLENSEHMLLSVGSDAVNKGTVYRSKYVIQKIGDSGIAYNMVDGKITLKTDKNIEVYALNSDGTRETMIDVERDEGKNAVFYLNGALNYEIVRG